MSFFQQKHIDCSALINKYVNSEFFRNVFVLSSGNMVAQAILMASVLVTTRLYTPENFGVLALFMASTRVIAAIGSLCYERAILLPKENNEAKNVLFLSVAILFFITLSVLVGVVFMNHAAADLVGNPEFAQWIWIIPIGVIFAGLVKILRFWRMRGKEFKSIAIANVTGASVSSITKISIGLALGAYAGGLIWGGILGMVVSSFLLLGRPTVFKIRQYLKDISKETIISVAKSYKQFPYFASWNVFLNAFSQNLVVFMLSSFFTPATVGFYSIGNRILKQPIIHVSESVQNVFFQKSAQDLNNDIDVLPGFKKATFALILVGIIPFMSLMIFGKTLFGVVLGQSWETAGIYVQILSPWFFLLFISSPSNVVYEIYQKQDLKLILNISKAVARSLALVGGCFFSRNPLVVLMLFAIVNVLLDIITIWVAFLLVHKVELRRTM